MDSISHSAPARTDRRNLPIPSETRFGRYTVIEGPFAKEPDLTRKRYYRCRCDCGTVKDVQKGNLLRGAISCGCYCRDRFLTHGDTGTRLYNTWNGIIARCCNPKNTHYPSYGGRGISICGEWRGSYEAFRDWARSHGYTDDLTIERIDVNSGYTPSNCTWIPRSEQARNKRNNRPYTAFGETKLMSDWAADPRCVVTRISLMRRLNKKWDAELALTTPPTPGIKQVFG